MSLDNKNQTKSISAGLLLDSKYLSQVLYNSNKLNLLTSDYVTPRNFTRKRKAKAVSLVLSVNALTQCSKAY